jgi:hypothetical protein
VGESLPTTATSRDELDGVHRHEPVGHALPARIREPAAGRIEHADPRDADAARARDAHPRRHGARVRAPHVAEHAREVVARDHATQAVERQRELGLSETDRSVALRLHDVEGEPALGVGERVLRESPRGIGERAARVDHEQRGALGAQAREHGGAPRDAARLVHLAAAVLEEAARVRGEGDREP